MVRMHHPSALMFLCPLLVLDLAWLARSGDWKGCTLSCGWCLGSGDVLPSSSSASVPYIARYTAVVLLSTASAACNLIDVAAYHYHSAERSSHSFAAWGWVACVPSILLVVCACVPMSCAALRPAPHWDWRWAGVNDYVHDFCFLGVLGVYILWRNPEANWGSSTQGQVFVNAVKQAQILTETPDHVKNYRPKVISFVCLISCKTKTPLIFPIWWIL